MSTSARPDDVFKAVRAGATGYLTKRCDAEMLVSGLRTVAAGGFLLSTELADVIQSMMGGPAASSSRDRPRLSPREDQTLRLLARGLTHAQIATRLGVRKPTVDTYVERIRAKLDVRTRADLIRASIDHENRPSADQRR